MFISIYIGMFENYSDDSYIYVNLLFALKYFNLYYSFSC